MNAGPVLEQLQRILDSQIFRGKPQLKQLLTLLMNCRDSQATLRPDRIIRELWPDDAGSKSSSDLAAVITRLRRALESYYASEGKDDPTAITLPDRSLRAPRAEKSQRWIVCTLRVTKSKHEPAEQQHDFLHSERVIPLLPLERNRKGRAWLRFGLSALAMVLLVAVAMFGFGPADNRPTAVRLDGNTLTVLNTSGRALWSKSFTDGFWTDYYKQGVAPRTWVGDLDGDGSTSVLFAYHPAVHPYEHSSTVICYSAHGIEKWRWTPGRAIPELNGSPPTFIVRGFGVLNASGGKPARIVVVSPHEPLDPTQVAVIDSHGRTISEYWHSGHLDFATLATLNGESRQFIVVTGVSNGYNQATLIVLDPDDMAGASIEKLSPREQIHGMNLAHERLRILFPRSDLNMATLSYNAGWPPIASEDGVRVAVHECELNPSCQIWYEFDRNMGLRSVYPDDRFRDAHRQYFANAPNTHTLTLKEETQFRKVRCLEGCRGEFVAFAPTPEDLSPMPAGATNAQVRSPRDPGAITLHRK